MNGKAFLACVLMSVVLTGCETAKKISQVIRNPDIQVGKLMDQSTELTVTLLTEPDSNLTAAYRRYLRGRQQKPGGGLIS
jgi:type VI secretion system protein VasD